jgi:hypothetical protein
MIEMIIWEFDDGNVQSIPNGAEEGRPVHQRTTVVHYCIKVLKVRYLYGGNDPKTICYTELGSELLLNDT